MTSRAPSHSPVPQDYGATLAPGARSPADYAASAIPSRGRSHPESPCPTRSPFQRDRDRILHATAFRRLIHKTQVFVFHEGDHYRTRLTHSLEVAQIARTIARQLRLDEDLAEVLALAHDMGHSPFGHAGERALDQVMHDHGGFDHNAQSLRVVFSLERKYAAFDGLNLTWETLEGLAKHNGPVATHHPVTKVLAHTERAWRSLDLHTYASAEAQVAALADDIAYLTHDTDDGLRAKLLKIGDLSATPLAGDAITATEHLLRADDPARRTYEITRRMITVMIADCVTQSRANLAALAPATPDDIRNASAPVITFSPAMAADIEALRTFLFARVYRHPRVMSVMTAAQSIVHDLFARYRADPVALPPEWAAAAARLDARRKARLIADFVSGQTDRYAIAEHRRLFDATPELR
ncbi:MAG: deoxyguanosinetriphosphate triphosphohydrolase [Hyphomicrobiaceae bacterium]